MKRLEYNRKVHTVPVRAGDSTEAAIALAQIVRERRRLQQERHTLLRRVGRIDLRLGEIGATEIRIVPILQSKSERGSRIAKIGSEIAVPQNARAKGFMEFTMQY